MTDLRLASGQDLAPSVNASSPADLATLLNFIGSQLNDACEELKRGAPGAESLTAVQADVRRARSLRNLRRKLLGDAYSGPGWEILLHLYDSYLHQFRDSVGSLADGAGIPTTTALRWIDRLEADGLVTTRDDPLDGRRRFVEPTAYAVEVMTKYFLGATTHLIAA